MSPTDPPEDTPALEARDIVKIYPGVRALDGVSLSLRRSRLNAVMGENGAGKSTLMQILAGVAQPNAGELFLAGRLARFEGPRDALAGGVAMIHQELQLAENMTVAENLFLGKELTTRWGLLDRRRMEEQTRLWMRRLGVDVEPWVRVGSLSLATQQAIEIAKALSHDAHVLILDEPTSALTSKEAESLFTVLGQLKSEGVALAYITHRFDELSGLADDVTVLRDGRLVGERRYVGLSRDELVRMMIGRDVPPIPRGDPPVERPPLLDVQGLSLRSSAPGRRPDLDSITLQVRPGEVVGLFGLMGAGRTELLETLYGLDAERRSGRVTFDGTLVSFSSPRDALRAGIALVPEDRKRAGLILGRSVGENLTLASLDRLGRAGYVDPRRLRRLAERLVSRLRIRTPSLQTPVSALSGGNQQKVVLGKLLATEPRVLLLDEPTRGVDVGARHEVYTIIRDLASEGCGVLFVSSEAPEVLALSDRILVMSEGKITAAFARGEADEQRLVEAALPRSVDRDAAA